MDFPNTSFFHDTGSSLPQLPSPTTILRLFPDQVPGVIKIEELNLAVKVGHSSYLRLEEAQTMIAMRQTFSNGEVPVPEVFGWRRYEDRVFIYMSLIRGETLREAWPSLTDTDKELVCGDLARIISLLKQVSQESSERFIGSINGGPVQDRFFKLDYEKGPFMTISSFNDWLLAAATRQSLGPDGICGPYREYLPDKGNIYFTHGDLTLGNIIVSNKAGSKSIVGIVDWEQAGWYPEYWEYCKLLYGVEYTHNWRAEGWAEKVMKSFENEWEVFAEYSSWRCP